MIAELSPGLIVIAGAFLVPLLRGTVRSAWMLALPVLGLVQLAMLPDGEFGQVGLFDLSLTTLRVDGLSRVFGYVFLLAALLAVIYSLHVRDTIQHAAALIYAGSATGAVFAGDLLTLFLYWEGTAIASVFLIWANRTERSFNAGMRYLVIQVGSGVLLLSGVIVLYRTTGSITFGHIGLEGVAGVLIFIAFGIKCAFPLLHTWLQDAYPEATVTGTVWLSAFTTKLAVYSLARGYAGTEILVAVGAVMAVFPIIYAILENEMRRVLAYSLNSQLGFMVVGVGIGTELSLNGTAAHAFSSVLYQGLLFMSLGAVLLRTGTARGTELGGLWKSMPWTAGFCIIGAASISAMPLFNGFVSKAMIVSAAMNEGYFATWLVLLLAGMGALVHTGIKIPYFVFFRETPNGAKAGPETPSEAPANMLVAMGVTAALCIGMGVFPWALYAILPYGADYMPYTVEHVVTQLQLLAFAALAFVLLLRKGLYPSPQPSLFLDFDWTYRRAGRVLAETAYAAATRVRATMIGVLAGSLRVFLERLHRHHGPQGILARTWPTGSMAFWATVLLAVYLIVYYA